MCFSFLFFISFDAMSPTSDYLARMGIWNLDGVVWHSQLLPFVLEEKNVNETLVMIVIDLSQPWNVLDSLERWTGVLRKHIDSLKISDKKRREMEDKSEYLLISTVIGCKYIIIF